MANTLSAVIAAGCPKPDMIERFQSKLGGKSLISHSLDAFDQRDDVNEVLLVVSEPLKRWIEGDPLTFSSGKLKLIDRGDGPMSSLAKGVKAATGERVLVHAGNRPNFTQDLIDLVLATVKPGIACVPGIAPGGAVAHLTEITEENAANGSAAAELFGAGPAKDRRLGHVMDYADPAQLYLLQTPQAFYRAELLAAISKAGDRLADYPDASALYIAGGFEVAVVTGHPGNLAALDGAVFNLLLKLMGSGTRRKKDRYGGLGW